MGSRVRMVDVAYRSGCPLKLGEGLFVHHQGDRLTSRQVQYLIERLYVRAGIRAHVPPGALVHALRHTFTTAALEGGANVVEVQQPLGHESLDTTRRYLDATANELRDAVRAHPSHLALQRYGSSQAVRALGSSPMR
jgi:integrase/recombinase XerD